MQAIILAAGYGTRMKDVSTGPKPLLPIGGKKMLDHIWEKISEIEDIKRVIVVTNNKFYSDFTGWNRTHQRNPKTFVLNDGTNSNEERLGAVGDLVYAIKEMKIDDDLLVVGGDNLFDMNMKDFFARFKQISGALVAVRDLGDPAKVANKFGCPEVNENNRIVAFHEKPENPPNSFASTAIYAFPKRLLPKIVSLQEDERLDNTGDLVRWIAENDIAYAFPFTEAWHDIGSPEEYRAVCEKYARRE